jgi:SAM-dependent methyltransferase
MPDQPDYHEDIQSLAAAAFGLAERHCGACRPMHSLWPYLRLARASTGAEGARSHLEPVLRDAFAAGHKRILIAGSCDTGVLALTARAGAGCDLAIAVLDACATPLTLCSQFAAACTLPLATMQVDLQELDVAGGFDLVLVHGTLHFVPPARQQDVVARLVRALRPGGLLVLLYNTSPRLVGELSRESREGYSSLVMDELARLGIPLPESAEAFRARLDAHARNREQREGAFADPNHVHVLLNAAGLTIEDEIEIEPAARGTLSELHQPDGQAPFPRRRKARARRACVARLR